MGAGIWDDRVVSVVSSCVCRFSYIPFTRDSSGDSLLLYWSWFGFFGLGYGSL